MFIRFDTTHERDRQTDTQTDTAWRHRPRLCIASSGKNEKSMPNASLLILNSPERLKRSMTELRPALERRLIGCCLTPYARSLNINSFRIYYRQACAAATDSMLRCLSIPGYQLVCVFSESGLNDCVQHEIDEYYSSFMHGRFYVGAGGGHRPPPPKCWPAPPPKYFGSNSKNTYS